MRQSNVCTVIDDMTNEENTTTYRSGFFPIGEKWPEWGLFIIGIGGGFQMFEDEAESTKWYEEFKKLHANDKPVSFKNEDEEVEPGKIGF